MTRARKISTTAQAVGGPRTAEVCRGWKNCVLAESGEGLAACCPSSCTHPLHGDGRRSAVGWDNCCSPCRLAMPDRETDAPRSASGMRVKTKKRVVAGCWALGDCLATVCREWTGSERLAGQNWTHVLWPPGKLAPICSWSICQINGSTERLPRPRHLHQSVVETGIEQVSNHSCWVQSVAHWQHDLSVPGHDPSGPCHAYPPHPFCFGT